MAWENGHQIIYKKHVIKKHVNYVFICIYTWGETDLKGKNWHKWLPLER